MKTLWIIVAACGLTMAASTTVHADELRFSYGISQQDLNFQPKDGAQVDAEWDDSVRLEVGAYSNMGWIWGFAGSMQQAEITEENGDWSLDYDGYTFRTYFGKAPITGRTFTWEILVFSGVGLARGDLTRFDGGESGDDSSFLFEVGAQTNLAMTVGRQFLIGAGAGYELVETSLDIGGDSALEQSGFVFQVFAGVRF